MAKTTVTEAKVKDASEDELWEAIKDPAVKELLLRRLPGFSKMARASRLPGAYPVNDDPRLTKAL